MQPKEPLLELSPRFTHLVEAGDVWVLVADTDSVVLEGVAVGELLRLLDGTRTAVQVTRTLSGAFRPQVVYLTLLQLEADGVVRECVSTRGTPQLDERALVLRKVWKARGGAGVVRTGPGDTCGIDQPAEGLPALLLTEDYLHPDLSTVLSAPPPNSPDVAAERVLVRLGPEGVWIGPRLGDPAGPCLTCVQTRLRLNLPGRALVADTPLIHPVTPSDPRDGYGRTSSTEHGVRIERLPFKIDSAVFQLLSERVDGIHSSVESDPAIWTFDLNGAPPTKHATPRLPHCPQCGDPTLQVPGAGFRLSSRESKDGSAGGLRILTPQETWEAYSPFIGPLTGVVRKIAKVEVGEHGPIHVYTANHANGLGPVTVEAIKDEGRDQSGGKGVSDLDARVSALGESLERFSALHRPTDVVHRARLSDLGPEAFHPNDLMLFSERQFKGRDGWNAGLAGDFQWVPEPYEDEAIGWSTLRSLVTGQTRTAPSAFIFLSYQGDGRRFCRSDSNGLAGGNCLEEAILQGFFELVERDAVALWWYNRGRVPGVEVVSLDAQYVCELEAYYALLGRDLWCLDLTTDLGIPCFGAFSARQDAGPAEPAKGFGSDIIFGFGCHLDPRVALRRALTELNQMLPTVLKTPEARRRHLLPEFRDALAWFDSADAGAQPYMKPARSSRPINFSTQHSRPWGIDDALQECVDRCQTAGLDVLVHDLTRQDVGFSVAKVVVPGLRHFWRRTGPGRLYDVPPKLGWTEGIQAEADLNPISMFV